MASVKETKVSIAGMEFVSSSSTKNDDPYIIALFGEENVGKTRLPLTGPSPIGVIPLEMKSFVTLDKGAAEFGKQVLMPKDRTALMVPKRKVDTMKDDVERQKFYIEHVKKVKDAIYGLLESKDVKLVLIDKFTTFCIWQEYAINGMTPKFIKVEGKVYQSKSEVRQSLIDFVNSLSGYKKPVILNCATKGDYEVLDASGNPARNTWDCGCFYMLGSHANLVCELEDNKLWNPAKAGDKFQWHYQLNIRRCQRNPELEGPIGNPALRDDEITLPMLVQLVEPEADLSDWM